MIGRLVQKQKRSYEAKVKQANATLERSPMLRLDKGRICFSPDMPKYPKIFLASETVRPVFLTRFRQRYRHHQALLTSETNNRFGCLGSTYKVPEVGVNSPAKQPYQRGFPATIGTQEGNLLARRHTKIGVLENIGGVRFILEGQFFSP